MIYFVYEVVTSDGIDAPGKVFAGCWINLDDQAKAEQRSKKFIEEQGYEVVEHVESYPIAREDYDDSPKGLEYYEQALIDDEVLVLFVSEGKDE